MPVPSKFHTQVFFFRFPDIKPKLEDMTELGPGPGELVQKKKNSYEHDD